MKLDFTYPKVMTIINVTPDSFFEGSRTLSADSILERSKSAVEQGAYILDIGAYSSRPGAEDISPREELKRLHTAIEVIRDETPDTIISIDTFRAKVAREIISTYGECIINDISAGEIDPDILQVAAEYNVPYIAMHMKGTPQNMNKLASYDNITNEIIGYFHTKIAQLKSCGVENIIIDPGFGFAKTIEQNFQLLGQMHRFSELGYPTLAGISRKSMIYKTLSTTPSEALNGTTALHWEALRQDASILRVHDTREAREIVTLWCKFSEQLQSD